MTKNDAQAKQTVRVFSAEGEEISSTYPKRAAGLVKKGRAHFVNDFDIRLNVSDVDVFTEENTMMDNNTNTTNNSAISEPVNKLYFNAREWSFNKACQNNVGSRSFMQGPDGVIDEAFMIGDWGYNWTEIVSRTLILPKNTLNTFTFWLNGGENDNNNEVCRFEVIFNDDYENRYTYNLNRNFVKPLKKCNGWELYEIAFRTGDNEYTQLRFVAQRAYMTVLNAKDVSEYANLADNADPFEQYRPQRHNIVFADGWPTNTWYSTAKLKAGHGENGENSEKPTGCFNQNSFPTKPVNNSYEEISAAIQGINAALNEFRSFDLDGFKENLKASLGGLPISDADKEEIIQSGVENAEEAISNVVEELEDSLEELEDSLEELEDSLEDMQD